MSLTICKHCAREIESDKDGWYRSLSPAVGGRYVCTERSGTGDGSTRWSHEPGLPDDAAAGIE